MKKADYFSVNNTLTDERFSTHPFVVSEPHIRFYAGVPLVTSEETVIGTLFVADRIPRELSAEQRNSLWILSRQIISRLELRKHAASLNRVLQAEIVTRQTAEESRVQLLHRLVGAHEEERGRIARELHDKMGQYLTGLIWGLQSLTEICEPHPPSYALLLHLLQVTNELMGEVHHLAWELRPVILGDLGLKAALGNYLTQWSERTGTALDFHICDLDKQRLSPDIEITVYRIVQETLTNILKHAQAKYVSVVVESQQNILQITVEDDGKGFDMECLLNKAMAESQLGLVGMKERAAMVQGTLDIESTPGDGTVVFVRIPLPLDDSSPGGNII